jgi:hypothetical protein
MNSANNNNMFGNHPGERLQHIINGRLVVYKMGDKLTIRLEIIKDNKRVRIGRMTHFDKYVHDGVMRRFGSEEHPQMVRMPKNDVLLNYLLD